jgi:hypothetical protein
VTWTHTPPTADELSLDELLGHAINGGADHGVLLNKVGDVHNENLARSILTAAGSRELHAAWGRGELTLCSRTRRTGPWPCPVHS